MKQKTISAWAVIISIIVGWDKIVVFLNSLLHGAGAVLNALPPIILLGLLIWIIIWLGNRD